jgi:hypothetical protein
LSVVARPIAPGNVPGPARPAMRGARVSGSHSPPRSRPHRPPADATIPRGRGGGEPRRLRRLAAMSLWRKTATRPGPTRPRAMVATLGSRHRPSSGARSLTSAVWSAGARRSTRRTSCRVGSVAVTHRDCVVPPCRTHHRMFDTGRLALVPYLTRRVRARAATCADARQLRRARDGALVCMAGAVGGRRTHNYERSPRARPR